METKSKKIQNMDLKQYGMFLILIGIFLLFAITTKGANAKPVNINNLIMQNGYVVILAIGMLLCVLTGNIDLGVGSVVAVTGSVACFLHFSALTDQIFSSIIYPYRKKNQVEGEDHGLSNGRKTQLAGTGNTKCSHRSQAPFRSFSAESALPGSSDLLRLCIQCVPAGGAAGHEQPFP